MQIHEITEGLLGNMLGAAAGNYSGFAQDAAASLQKKGYGAGYQNVDANKIWTDKYQAVQKDRAVQQYINSLVAAWQQQSKTSIKEADILSTIKPAGTGGPTPAEQAALAQKLQAASTPALPTTLGGQFQQWSDARLASRVPGTGDQITMDEVRKLAGLGPRLEQALAKVNGAQGTPVQATAIKEYLELAIAGIQALSQQSKSMRATGSKLSGKYAKSTGNAQADAVLKAAGFNIS
jgi:hypothetical protein